MQQYHKIETLYTRDIQGTKKLIEGTFRNPLVEYIQDCEWIFTEKIDGTNIRIFWDGHKVTFNGRTDNAELHGHLVDRLNELFVNNATEELFEQKFGEKEVMFIGEGYGAGIQKGGGEYIENKDFILFDVMVDDIFLERADIEKIAKAFNLQVVPLIPLKTIKEAVQYVKTKPLSMVGKCIREIEGVIGVPKVRITDFRGNRVIVKIKVEDFT